MHQVFLSLGSNLGDREWNLRNALTALNRKDGHIRRISSLYETEPWGCSYPMKFINLVAEYETILEPDDLLESVHEVERLYGREHSLERYAPRTVDIDILMVGDLVIESEKLTIPHPSLHLRKFVLVPFVEIAPEIVHPLFKKPVRQLLKECDDEKEVIQTGTLNF